MRAILISAVIIFLLALPVSALEIEAPQAPESAEVYLPRESKSFSEDLWYIIRSATETIRPSITEASKLCFSMIAVVLLISLTDHFSKKIKPVLDLCGTLGVAVLMFASTNSLIRVGVATIKELTEYGKLLLPVMTTALAAQGGITSSGVMYFGTSFFGATLAALISNIAVPLVYIFLCLSVANGAIGEKVVESLRNLSKWVITWLLKIVLYVFTGYMTVTGVVSGATDVSALKATKIAISGSVPVVGNILADASEAILVSAGVMKSAAGAYGILALIAICIGPFLKIAVQYLMIKITAAICSVFGTKQTTGLLNDFSTAMGLVLAMTGTVCLLHLISTVCFMKGVS